MDFVLMDRSVLPPEEHEAASGIELNLKTLQMQAQEFRQTAHLYLFAHARQRLASEAKDGDHLREMIGLERIAGRNGAVVAHSFDQIMTAINRANVPTIWDKADMSARDAATKLFAAEFPAIGAIRRSAAHPGELTKSVAKQAQHRLKERLIHPHIQATAPLYVESMMVAEPDSLGFGATVAGEYRAYELSLRKADVLDEAAKLYCRTFYPLENPEQAAGAQYIRESGEQHLQNQKRRPPWWHSLILP